MAIKNSAAQFVIDHLDEIEHKIAMGIYHASILAELTDAGHEMTLASFRKSLNRARSKKAHQPVEHHATNNVARSQYLAMGRLTPDELAQVEKSSRSTKRGFI